jgi:hypothetical protein
MANQWQQSSTIPPALLGQWSQGSSAGSMVDPFGLPSGPFTSSGFMYRFEADGTYEFSGSMSAGGSGVSIYERGLAEVVGDQLTLSPSEGTVRQPDGTTTPADLTPKVYRWQVALDFIGSVTLMLALPDGQMDVFYR